MGFDLYQSVGKLQFAEDSAYAGAEVTVRLALPFVRMREFWSLNETEGSNAADEWEWFREHALVGWNLEEGDVPIPTDAPYDRIPTALRRAIVLNWLAACAEVPGPLARRSPAGST